MSNAHTPLPSGNPARLQLHGEGGLFETSRIVNGGETNNVMATVSLFGSGGSND